MFAIVTHDLLLAGVSLWFALSLRFSFEIPAEYVDVLLFGGPLFLAIAGITFHSFGMYRALWRYASVPDLMAIIKAVTVAIVIFCLASFAINRLEDIPRSVPVIQWLLLIVMLGGSRIMIRALRGERWTPLRRKPQPIPVLVVGATNDASLFIRATHESAGSPFRVLGILDDSGDQTGRSLHRVPMLGPIDDLEKVVARLAARGRRPQQLIMATPPGRLNPEAVGRLMDQAERLGLAVARVPSMVDFQSAVQDGAVELRPFKLEDLLGRAQVELDQKPITDLIRGRRVLITGAGGSIGRELSSQIAALSPDEIILVDHGEYHLYGIELELREQYPKLRCCAQLCDIRDKRRVDQVFAQHRPHLVFNSAALKHVPLVEANPCDGVLTNVIGTRNVADAALRHQALAMIQISTDKAIHPASAMGVSKRLAEDYCQALDVANRKRGSQGSRFITVRFGNVLGSSGSVVPLFQRQLSRGGPLTVTHPEIRRFFMTVREAVELVLHASAHGIEQQEHRGQIFVLDMGQPIKIVDIAHQMIRLAGLRPDIDVKIEFTGLRPGERLDEELFDDGETQLPTAIPGLFTAISCVANLNVLGRELDQLAALARQHDQKELRALLSRMVPSYTGGVAALSDRGALTVELRAPVQQEISRLRRPVPLPAQE